MISGKHLRVAVQVKVRLVLVCLSTWFLHFVTTGNLSTQDSFEDDKLWYFCNFLLRIYRVKALPILHHSRLWNQRRKKHSKHWRKSRQWPPFRRPGKSTGETHCTMCYAHIQTLFWFSVLCMYLTSSVPLIPLWQVWEVPLVHQLRELPHHCRKGPAAERDDRQTLPPGW